MTTATLLWPQLAADTLPAVSGRVGEAIVLSTAGPRAGSTTGGTAFVVGLVEVRHGIVAHGGSARRRKRIAHAAGASAARVVRQCVTTAAVARGHACRGRRRRRGRGLGGEASVGEGACVHEVGCERRWGRGSLVCGLVTAGVIATFVVAAGGAASQARVMAVVAGRGRVGTLRAYGVEEGNQYTLLHQFVDFGYGLVQSRRMWWYIRVGQIEKGVANISRKVDLVGLVELDDDAGACDDIPLLGQIHECRHLLSASRASARRRTRRTRERWGFRDGG